MATRAGFRSLATKLINNTFADFRDTVTLAQAGEVDYNDQSTAVSNITSDTTKGIRVDYNKTQIDGQNIQTGDYKVLVLQQGLNTDVRADNVTMTFNGISVSIVSVSEDAAQAVYTLQVREL
jgi:hypothetical protein